MLIVVPSMGSPNESNVQPHTPMANEKNLIKNIFKKPFQALFQKDKKKEKLKKQQEEQKEIKDEITKPTENINVTPVTVLLENFTKLKIEKDASDNEDEFGNFSYKVIEDDSRDKRIDSHSSEDSGFADKCSIANDSDDEKEDTDVNHKKDKEDTADKQKKDDKDDDVLVESLNNLKVSEEKVKGDDEKKQKKLQTVYLPRLPTRHRTDHSAAAHPYPQNLPESGYRQINRQTFSGGQVIVNSNLVNPIERPVEKCTNVLQSALDQIDKAVDKFSQNTQEEKANRWELAQKFIEDESEEILSDFNQLMKNYCTEITNYPPNKCPSPNPVEKFSTTDHTYEYDLDFAIIDEQLEKPSIFPTPPHSENVQSPMSDSQASFYPVNSSYTLSPDTSSPMYNSDYEKYQDIPVIEDYPSCVTENTEDKDTEKKREKATSMTLKQFKDMQKQIAADFAKKECCQMNRKSCKAIFEEHAKQLEMNVRQNLCFKVASLDFKTAYGVLHHILINLSNDKDVDINMVLFSLICEKLLASNPLLFVDDFGLSILKMAVLRCNNRPLLTRYIVQCIRSVTRSDTYKPTKEHVFSEVDMLGDTLVIACARAGDECADVLSELMLAEEKDVPLFNVHHANTDGYTALHVCCAEHSARTPRAHALHVLLRHASADLWRGDIKGGDTALHLAVNSANCDLALVMILFQHVDRKDWRRLAHVQNRSSVNPLEYARSAVKSTTRQNYPTEVLEFLKKCR